ncbi:ATP-dependent Clp protease proteolytic subunit-related protein 2, chloroplastic [Glycine max]|nr:ATP-dependent Clp protease proteolytic subunit-related protein 2, chloroplastic [Glycine max]
MFIYLKKYTRTSIKLRRRRIETALWLMFLHSSSFLLQVTLQILVFCSLSALSYSLLEHGGGTLHHRFRTSVATKLYSGLKLQAASSFRAARPNVTAEFYGKVHNTLHCRKVLGKHPKDEHESSNCNERDSSGNGSNLDYHHSFGEISCASKKGGRIKKTQLDGPQRLKPILKFRASEVVKIKLEKPSMEESTIHWFNLLREFEAPLTSGKFMAALVAGFEKQRPAPCNTPRLTEMKSKGLCFRYANHNPSMARIRMMPIGTPKVPYRTPGEGTWQWVDVWNALYRERVIFIGQEIDEEFSNQILATMLYLDSIDNSKKLYMYINGPGGDLTPSMAIYDTMQSLQSPVATHCVGYAYSLAAFLLAAGEKSNRSAMPLSRVALTSPAGAARGQADDIQNEANELLRIRDYLFNELSKKTGQPLEKITKDLSRMKRFNAQEALEYGLIDRIVRPPRIKADAPRKEAGTGLG